MAWDLESLGGGGIGGAFFGILTAFGLKGKVNKIEKEKQDIRVCEAIHKGIEAKFEFLCNGQEKIFERLDSISDFLRNQK